MFLDNGQQPYNPYHNPYQSTRPWTRTTRGRGLQWAVALIIAGGLVFANGHRYLSVSASAVGFLVGALLLVIGWAVGRVISTQGATRWLALVSSFALSVVISQGWVDHQGGELTLWAFASIGCGVFAGAAGPAEVDPPEADVSATPDPSDATRS